jgi:hypothetical protein
MKKITRSKWCILLVFAAILIGCTKENEAVKNVKEIDIKTLEANNITTTTAVLTANLNSGGEYVIKSRGICVNTQGSPTLEDKNGFTVKDPTNAVGNYNGMVSRLLPNTKYYGRAYLSNDAGVFYANEISFTTTSAPITTLEIEEPDTIYDFAKCGGIIGTNIDTSIIVSCGVCWSDSNQTPIIYNNKTVDKPIDKKFSSTVTGIYGGRKYYVRAYVTTNLGTEYGEVVSFTAKMHTRPIVETLAYKSSGEVTGKIINDGGYAITNHGFCYSDSDSNQTPVIGNCYALTQNFKILLPSQYGLFGDSVLDFSYKKTFYVRAYATNNMGTSYGSVIKATY